jgi:hypothetical protein
VIKPTTSKVNYSQDYVNQQIALLYFLMVGSSSNRTRMNNSAGRKFTAVLLHARVPKRKSWQVSLMPCEDTLFLSISGMASNAGTVALTEHGPLVPG